MQKGWPASIHSSLSLLMCLSQLSLVLVRGNPGRQVRICSLDLKRLPPCSQKGRLHSHVSNVLHLACPIRRTVTELMMPSKSCHARGLCLPHLRLRVCLECVEVRICGRACADEPDKSGFIRRHHAPQPSARGRRLHQSCSRTASLHTDVKISHLHAMVRLCKGRFDAR